MAKVNGNDFRKYNAKQLTVDVQPPSTAINYEWITRALLPTEFDTTVQMGHMTMEVFFRGNDRNSIVRSASAFMANFTKACDLELDGYKGKYRGFLAAGSYKKTITKSRYIISIELDGFFYDEELEVTFDGKQSGLFYKVGSRVAPCILEIYAKESLSNYAVSGLGDDDIIVKSLAAGKTIIVDGTIGLVTVDGKGAFDKVILWEFPRLEFEEMRLKFTNLRARVTIRYHPMWI